MWGEQNVAGIDYGLSLPYIIDCDNGKVLFKEQLIYVFDDMDIRQECDNYLSIKMSHTDISQYYPRTSLFILGECVANISPFEQTIIDKISAFYNAVEWYNDIEDFTIKSYLIKIPIEERDYLITNKCLSIKYRNIVTDIVPTGEFFYRLDSLSSKYTGCLTLDEAILHITTTTRSVDTLLKSPINYLFIRSYIDFSKWVEYRCFITNREVLGISVYDTKIVSNHSNNLKTQIMVYLKKIIELLIYTDCVIDIAVEFNNINPSIFVVEINCPVYLLSASANFTAIEVRDILLYKNPEYDYPVWKL